MEHPKRKSNRIKNYDYSMPGAYFITICTKGRKDLFWENAEAIITRREDVVLSAQGRIVDYAVRNIPRYYPGISLDHYAVMPNHVHLLLQIHTDSEGNRIPAPSIARVVQQMKGYVTKTVGCSIWQKLYHDHMIRTEEKYQLIWQYIDNNPMKWAEDGLRQDKG